MTTWHDVEAVQPEFVQRVRALFDARRHKTIATVRADGSPRISGIEAVFEDGELVFGSMPGARKGADLRRAASDPNADRSGDRLPAVSDLISSAAVGYAEAHTTPFEGPIAGAAEWTQSNSDTPQMMSGLAEARLLEALIVLSRARRVLEIGTFTGVGTLSMAAALPADGRITTLELNEETAAAARRHIDASPHSGRIELIVGDALETIARLDGPFDLVYVDAWKSDYPAYYDAVLPKLSERGVIVADNLFLGGRAIDDGEPDERAAGIREFARRAQEDERVHNVLLSIGDGVMLVWHRP